MNVGRIETLTATVDQLQAEVDRMALELLLWASVSVALGLLLIVLAAKVAGS